MNQELIKLFVNDKFGNVRVVLIGVNQKPHFVGRDVATALGYKDAVNAIKQHCRGVVKHHVENSRGQMREANVIPEGDLYRLITHSQLESAEQFESWVFDEVLPSIRKHGMYAVDELLDNPDLLISTAQRLKEEKIARLKAEQELEASRPKVLFADAVSASKSSILIGELAKILKQNGIDKMGQNRLFDWLRGNGYLISRNGTDYNMPTQRAMELKLFEIKETTVTHSDGHISVSKTAKVTGKGQQYFIHKFLEGRKG